MVERATIDFHDTLVRKAHRFSRGYTWIEGMPTLLDMLTFAGSDKAIWTADMVKAVTDTNRHLMPALLGLSGVLHSDEVYGRDNLPSIPAQYDPPYPPTDVTYFMNVTSQDPLHGPMLNQQTRTVGKREYENQDDFLFAVRRLLLQYDMERGWKFPPVICSDVLMDDLYGSNTPEDMRLQYYAKQFGFRLVDPRRRPNEYTFQWIDRIVGQVMKQ